MRVIALKEEKDLDKILTKMQMLMYELAEIERIIKEAERQKQRYEELKQELAKVCREYYSLYGED